MKTHKRIPLPAEQNGVAVTSLFNKANGAFLLSRVSGNVEKRFYTGIPVQANKYR